MRHARRCTVITPTSSIQNIRTLRKIPPAPPPDGSCYACDLCKQEFRTKNELRTHVQSYHISVEETIATTTICSRCDCVLQESRSPDEVVCRNCDKPAAAATKSAAVKDEADVPALEPDDGGNSARLLSRWTCDSCGKHYSRQSKFRQHTGTEVAS